MVILFIITLLNMKIKLIGRGGVDTMLDPINISDVRIVFFSFRIESNS